MSDILRGFVPSRPDGWTEATIGEALTEIDRPIRMRDCTDYRLASIRRRNGGMFHRETLSGRKILTKTLREVVPGSFVLARMQVVHGACALVPDEFAGYAISKSYSSFVGNTECDVRYFFHLAKQPFMYRYFMDASHGVVIEKMTFDQNRWLSFPIYLPPVDEQRRIVDILDEIDDSIRANERLIAKLELMLLGMQAGLLAPLAASEHGARSIRSLISNDWPGEWGMESPRSGHAEARVLRATNLNGRSVEHDRGAIRYVPAKTVAVKQLMPGDLILEASGGGPGVPVGRVARYRPTEHALPSLVSNFFRTLRPGKAVDPDFLYWTLDYVYRQPSIWACQQQTTGIINLKLHDYLSQRVGVPRIKAQQSIAAALDSIELRIQEEAASLLKLRDIQVGLAADLLSGRVRTVMAT